MADTDGDDSIDQGLVSLAELAGIKPELLRDVARRLSEDAQVQMLTTLYQFETEEVSKALAGTEGPGDGQKSLAKAAS